MKFTAMDITTKEFKKGFRGYDVDEVEEFLEEISENYEAVYKENSFLKEKVSTMEENVKHYSRMEDTIQNTLLLAQNAAEQAKKSAQKESDFIIKNANQTAQKLLDKAHNDVIRINDDYENTKQEFVMFRTKFKSFMKSQLEMFQKMEQDFVKHYNVGTCLEEKDLNEKEIEVEDEKKDENQDKQIEIKKDVKEESLDEIKNFFVKD